MPPVVEKLYIKAFEGYGWTLDNNTIESYNEVIAIIAKQENIVLNDMREIYKKSGYENVLAEDGLHLNPDGQYLLAKELMWVVLKNKEELNLF